MIIIAGASKSIGRYLFEQFREAGERVYGTYNSTLQGFETDAAQYTKVNLTDYAEVESWIQSIPEKEKITLICCAGISQAGFAHKAKIADWQRVVEVNLFGSFNVIHALLPIMRKQGYGRIVLMSSVVAKYPTPGVSAYAASKGALISLAKSLAVENASKGVTVNAIGLGYVNLGMGVNDVSMEYQEAIKMTIPEHRFCEPEEIFNTINYIINTPYVNGSTIDINGGMI